MRIGSTLTSALSWRRPTAEASIVRAGQTGLRRTLGRLDLSAMGVGSIVGAGIFVTSGLAATKAGPALVVSFLVAGVVCLLVALCYSEMASMVPLSGSAYTYTFATLGEVAAFAVGWNLLLEYTVAGAAVAIGWSGLFTAAVEPLFGVTLPAVLTAGPAAGGIVNLPAMVIVALAVGTIIAGVRLTAGVVKVLVALTIGALLLVIAVGVPHIDPANWQPFVPFGIEGVMGGAALGFFAYIGFDAVATSAEECRNPRRDLPFALILSIAFATVLFMAVSVVLTGVAPYATLNSDAPMATVLGEAGSRWTTGIVLVVSLVALTKTLLMVFFGLTRLMFAICRDALLPVNLAKVGRRGTPVRLGILLGVVIALIAGLLPIGTVAELVNIGALFAYALVALGVLVLRWLEPGRERPFRTPFVPLLPLLAIAGCVWLMTTLSTLTWLRFFGWLAVGVLTYSLYGRRHSVMGRPMVGEVRPRATSAGE